MITMNYDIYKTLMDALEVKRSVIVDINLYLENNPDEAAYDIGAADRERELNNCLASAKWLTEQYKNAKVTQ